MQQGSHLTRRSIIKQFALGTASSRLAGGWVTERVLAASSPLIESLGVLTLDLNEFPALLDDPGSLRLDVGLTDPILVNRSGGSFYAMSARCQHNGCTVSTFNAELGVIVCPCHGSQYNIDGSLNSGPAERGLDTFQATFTGGSSLNIPLPGVLHAANSVTLVNSVGNVKRLRLTFHAKIFTSYQVLYRANLTDAPQIAAFSLTPTGAPTQLIYRNAVFNPDDPVPEVALYVETTGATGFFSISLLARKV